MEPQIFTRAAAILDALCCCGKYMTAGCISYVRDGKYLKIKVAMVDIFELHRSESIC